MTLLFVLACSSGKESDPEESVAALPSLAADVQPIFNAQCVRCHGPLPAPEGLSLAEGSTWLERGSKQVENMVLVEPGSPDSSYLWLKLTAAHTSMGGYGTKMPPDADLSAGELGTIEGWILAGAQP